MTDTLMYFEVVQPKYEDVQTNDETGGGNLPEVHAFSGTVTFTPSVAEVHSADLNATIMLQPIRGRFALPDGDLSAMNDTPGVSLVDNQHLGLDEGALTYRVDYSNVTFDGESGRHVQSFRFAAPGDGSQVNLNTVARLPL